MQLIGYSDADWMGSIDDRKSTSGCCYFLGNCLVAWHSEKQNSVSLSTVEAEYIAAGSCCAQLLWMKQTMLDYNVPQQCMPIMCDNSSAICISKNPIQHSRTKHIDIRYHFLRDHADQGNIELAFVPTDAQLANFFTKPLGNDHFISLRHQLGNGPCPEC